MRRKWNKKNCYRVVCILIGIAVTVICMIMLSVKDSKEAEQISLEKEAEHLNPSNQKANEEEQVLLYFQEENLSFLLENTKKTFVEEFEKQIKESITKGEVTCCVILSNIEALSEQTYRFYVQTNRDTDNIYQVIVNEKKSFLEITSCEKTIENIEVYGGVTENDNIERLYIYGEQEPGVR